MEKRTIIYAIGAVVVFLAVFFAVKPRPALATYRAGPDNLGVGVYNLAREQSADNPRVSILPPLSRAVRGSLAPFMQSNVPNATQDLPTFDLRGNGVYLSGDMRLTPLSVENK